MRISRNRFIRYVVDIRRRHLQCKGSKQEHSAKEVQIVRFKQHARSLEGFSVASIPISARPIWEYLDEILFLGRETSPTVPICSRQRSRRAPVFCDCVRCSIFKMLTPLPLTTLSNTGQAAPQFQRTRDSLTDTVIGRDRGQIKRHVCCPFLRGLSAASILKISAH